MSIELYPVLEDYEEQHFYSDFGGKSLMQDLDQLDNLAEIKNLRRKQRSI